METPPLSPLDDRFVHQIPEPVRHVGASDRNFHDRHCFNEHACSDGFFVILGMGQYPDLGAQDAVTSLRLGIIITPNESGIEADIVFDGLHVSQLARGRRAAAALPRPRCGLRAIGRPAPEAVAGPELSGLFRSTDFPRLLLHARVVGMDLKLAAREAGAAPIEAAGTAAG